MAGREIWILNHYAISPDLPGGTRHYDLAVQLVRKGHRVTIFASGFDYISKRYTKVGPKQKYRAEDIAGVRFVWVNTAPYQQNDWRRVLNMLSYSFRVLTLARRFNRPELIVGSSVHPFAVIAAWLLAFRYRSRFFFEIRDLWPQTLVDMGSLKPAGVPARLLYAWEKFMCARAEKVIVLLPYARDYLKGRGISPEKVTWIPNGVLLERFDLAQPLDPESEAAGALARSHDKFTVVYTGAHGPANGLDTTVEAAEILTREAPGIRIVLVGDGPEKKRLREMAEMRGLDNIVFLDPVPKTRVASVLKQADLLLHSLRPLAVLDHGISPNKLFEYLAAARPVIITLQGRANVVEEAGAGLAVEPGSPEALAGAIIQMRAKSPGEREALGMNGRAYVAKNYDMKMLGDRLAQLFVDGG